MDVEKEKIGAIIESAIENKQLVGASVGIAMGREVLVAQGYGHADLNANIKASSQTVYRIGSITKQFTAVAIMMLIEQGAIGLKDSMLDYLPDYPVRNHEVTIEQLLTHTSGIKSMTDLKTFWDVSQKDLSRKEMVELFAFEPVDFLPGEKFQYNNSGYYLLGLIIEHVTHLSYAEFLQKKIWDPLGMNDTHYLGGAAQIENHATGYVLKDNEFVAPTLLGMENPYAGGALGSSVQDLLTWQMALNDHQLISKKGYDQMIDCAILNDGTKVTYGYGFFLSDMDGHRKIEHGGDINGFRAQLSYYPNDELTVVVLCNLESAPRGQLESQIARVVLGIPERIVPEVIVSEGECQMYVGTYHFCSFKAPTPFPVSFEDGTLRIGRRPIFATGKHAFVFSDDPYWTIVFTVQNGRSVGFKVEREGQMVEAVREDQ